MRSAVTASRFRATNRFDIIRSTAEKNTTIPSKKLKLSLKKERNPYAAILTISSKMKTAEKNEFAKFIWFT